MANPSRMKKARRTKFLHRMGAVTGTAKVLATLSGVHFVTISKIVNRAVNPRPATVHKLCRTLRCRPIDVEL